MSLSTESFLAHHGVKGMRWGVRASRNEIQRLDQKASNKLMAPDRVRLRRLATKIQETGSTSKKFSLEKKYDNLQDKVLAANPRLQTMKFRDVLRMNLEARSISRKLNKGRRAGTLDAQTDDDMVTALWESNRRTDQYLKEQGGGD